MVFRVYRRQAFVRDVCRLVGYGGRYVWVIGYSEVPILGARFHGETRIRYRVLSLTPLKIQTVAKEESKKIKLSRNLAMVALPVVRRRKRALLLFLHPDEFSQHVWVKAGNGSLAPEEQDLLLGRIQKHTRATQAVARAVCRYRNLVDRYDAPTKHGLRIISEYFGKRDLTLPDPE